ncbi:MAG: FAD-dependent oxidoreductase, partial [Rubrivivax sp.]|nr:FAD-dependent oxidoreductase [Rubrivivax sp.]
EMTRHVYLALMNAGQDLGLRDAGYYALDALRIEAGRRAWGAELGPDETPFVAGLAYAISLDKPGFIGREALLAARGQPLRKKLMAFLVNDPAHYLWGGESIVLDGRPVGEVSSGGWSLQAGACMALGYVRGEAAAAVQEGTAVHIDLWGQPVAATARRV